MKLKLIFETTLLLLCFLQSIYLSSNLPFSLLKLKLYFAYYGSDGTQMTSYKSQTEIRSEGLYRVYSTLNTDLSLYVDRDILLTPTFKLKGDTQYIQKNQVGTGKIGLLNEIQINQKVITQGIDHLCLALTRRMIHLWQVLYNNPNSDMRNHDKEWVNKALEVGLSSNKPYGRTIKLEPITEGRYMKVVEKLRYVEMPLPTNPTQYFDSGVKQKEDRNLDVWVCPVEGCSENYRASKARKPMCGIHKRNAVRKDS